VIRVSDEVREAGAVVALETTIVAHGFPPGEGTAVGIECEQRVREAGAVPATIGVLDGEIRVGLTEGELERFDASARKAGPRELGVCVARGEVGATTVGGTLAVCRAAGIRFMGTGGIGGVHRGDRMDISADVLELSRSQVAVVSSGVKSLLDVEATAELLETLSVLVLGWRTDTMPRFYDALGGPPVTERVESAEDAVRLAQLHWEVAGCGVLVLGWRTDTMPRFYDALGGPPVTERVESAEDAVRLAQLHWEVAGCGVLVARPPDESLDADELMDEALLEAERQGVSGQAVTPFVLSRIHERSGGRTLRVNRALASANAGLAAELAVAAA
jgi:pseudouridine-5'-phosphate glycosidase